jgi:hypothetical protein
MAVYIHTYIYIYIYTHVRVCNIAWAHLYTINIYKPVMAKTCKNCLCSILHGRLSLFGSRLSSPQDPAHGNIDPKYMGNLDFRWCFDWGIWMCHRISASFRCTAASVPLTQASAHAWRLSHPKKNWSHMKQLTPLVIDSMTTVQYDKLQLSPAQVYTEIGRGAIKSKRQSLGLRPTTGLSAVACGLPRSSACTSNSTLSWE